MPRVAKGKKAGGNAENVVEKPSANSTTLDQQKELNNLTETDVNHKESALNGNAEPKVSKKPTKSAKNKTVESNGTESKSKAGKKGKSPANEVIEDIQPEIPAAKETKKRANNKKLVEQAENGVEEKNTSEPVSDVKESSGKKEVKKRGRKEPAKPEATATSVTVEPEKKRSKRQVNADDSADTKKKVTKRKADTAEAQPEEADEKPKRGKTAKKDESEKPQKKGAAKATKIDQIQSEEPAKKSTRRAKTPVTKEPKETPAEEEPTDKSEVVTKPKKDTASKNAQKPAKSPKQPVKDKSSKQKAKSPGEKKKLQNSTESDYNIDFGIDTSYNLKITMWNTSGLRSCVEKGCVDYFKHENADIICINEIKCGGEHDIPEKMKLDGYHAYWNIAKGQPGVGILSKQMPMEIFYDLPGEFSDEKRLITAEYKKFYLVCTYVVNAGRGLKTLDKRLKWNKVFDDYIKDLDKKKPVIIAGDMNVAHTEIDLANPKSNQKNAGFTKEERDGFTQLLSYGFIDTFRNFYPDQRGAYTFWSYMGNARSKNVGWRLDYFLTSERLIDKVKDSVIRSGIRGSDHCPIVLFLEI